MRPALEALAGSGSVAWVIGAAILVVLLGLAVAIRRRARRRRVAPAVIPAPLAAGPAQETARTEPVAPVAPAVPASAPPPDVPMATAETALARGGDRAARRDAHPHREYGAHIAALARNIVRGHYKPAPPILRQLEAALAENLPSSAAAG